jgi:hypothetical protein
MQVQNDGGAAGAFASGAGDEGVETEYDQDNDAHHVIQPQVDTDGTSTDTDEG